MLCVFKYLTMFLFFSLSFFLPKRFSFNFHSPSDYDLNFSYRKSLLVKLSSLSTLLASPGLSTGDFCVTGLKGKLFFFSLKLSSPLICFKSLFDWSIWEKLFRLSLKPLEKFKFPFLQPLVFHLPPQLPLNSNETSYSAKQIKRKTS